MGALSLDGFKILKSLPGSKTGGEVGDGNGFAMRNWR